MKDFNSPQGKGRAVLTMFNEAGDFYGDNLIDSLLINIFTYRGKGRPRKTDYITLKEANRLLNEYRNLDKKGKFIL